DARRRDSRGAGSGGRIRRGARGQADGRAGAAGRISDRRVPARTRHRRLCGPTVRAQGDGRAVASPHEWEAGVGRVDDLLTQYSEAIQALFARTTGGIKPGLERTEALLAEVGSPHKKLSAIHVAGTNGKGSVVATCEALLRARGLKVGKYTSPHLIDFRERITVNGLPISEAEV